LAGGERDAGAGAPPSAGAAAPPAGAGGLAGGERDAGAGAPPSAGAPAPPADADGFAGGGQDAGAPPAGDPGARAGGEQHAGAAASAGDRAGAVPPAAGLPPRPPPSRRPAGPPAEEPPSSAATVPPVARRGGADGPVDRTLVSRVGDAPPGVRTEHRTVQRRRRALAAGAAVVLLGGGVAVALALNSDPPAPQPTPTATATATATPAPNGARAFDFDGDGDPAVVAGLPGWRAAGVSGRAGAVALPGTSVLLPGTELDPPVEGAFGAAVASGDFDRDAHADLAVGSPGADADDAEGREGAVTIVPGSDDGLVPDRAATRPGPGVSGPFRAARYGVTLAAGDFDRDRFADLVIGIPGARSREGRPGSGALQLIFGGPGGLQENRTRTIVRPDRAMDGFGTLVRAGDANRDGHVDLVEASPGDPGNGIPGHANYCPGRRDGPVRCRPLAGIVDAGPASLAIADMTGDDFPEVIGGIPAAGAGAGAVSVWLGQPSGPADLPVLITQESLGVDGNSQPEDRFGAALATARIDGDGAVDLVVAAPGEDEGKGRVTVLMGGPDIYDPATVEPFGSSYGDLPVAEWDGAEFGAAVTIVDTAGDDRPALTVAVPGTGQLVTLPNTGTGFTDEGSTAQDLRELPGDGELPDGSPIFLR
jgi:hypothetical protein